MIHPLDGASPRGGLSRRPHPDGPAGGSPRTASTTLAVRLRHRFGLVLGLVLGLLGLLTTASLSPPAAARPFAPTAPVLAGEPGTTRILDLEPAGEGRLVLELAAGEAVELWIDRPAWALRALAFPPGVTPEPCPWSRLAVAEGLFGAAPEPTGEGHEEDGGTARPGRRQGGGEAVVGQRLRFVAEASGPHTVVLAARHGGGAAPATVHLVARRPALETDWMIHLARQLGRDGVALRRRDPEASRRLLADAVSLTEAADAAALRINLLYSLGWSDLDHRGDHLRRAAREATALGDGHGAAVSLTAHADWLLANDRLDEAERTATEATVWIGTTGDPMARGELARVRGLIDLAQGEFARATESLHEAARWIGRHGTPDRAVDATYSLGRALVANGEIQDGLETYGRALSIVERHERDPVVASWRPLLLLGVGTAHDYRGEFSTALNHYLSALPGLDASGDRRLYADALYIIGTLHQRLGNLDEAMEHLGQARDLYDKTGGVPIPGVLRAIALIHKERGDLATAMDLARRDLEICEEQEARHHQALAYDAIGRILLADDRPREAMGYFRLALDLQTSQDNRRGEARQLGRMAQAHHALGQYDAALAALDRARAINAEIGERSSLVTNHYDAARIERDRGDLTAARAAIERALETVRTIRSTSTDHEVRAQFSAGKREVHDFHIDLLMELHTRDPEAGHDAEALWASEQARVQGLLDILAESSLGIGNGSDVPPELAEERRRLIARLAELELAREQRLRQRRPGTADGDRDLYDLKLELARLLSSLRETEQRIRAASPRWAALTQPEPVDAESIQGSLLDPSTVLLEYSLGGERSFLWVVTPDNLDTFVLPERAAIEARARQLHELMTQWSNLDATADPAQRRSQRRQLEREYDLAARDLSRTLLGGPAGRGLLADKHLVVVSEGALEYVPFAALLEPGPGDPESWPWLVEGHEITRLPSASVLAFQRRVLDRDRPEPTRTLAVVAAPVYHGGDPRIAAVRDGRTASRTPVAPPIDDERRQPFYRTLAWAEDEARRISSFADPEESLLILGLDASRETVLSGVLADFRYLHFATHGEIDTEYPELSKLVLSLVDERGVPRTDGFLRLRDVYELELAADLVVLSACETALGRELRGEGLVGLTRGFMYAGAERVIASLWQVQDRATAELMTRFYDHLLDDGDPPARALREAQVSMLREETGRWRFPYYWAGFVLQGEWR